MFEELNQHRAAVAEQIQKACEIGFTGNELEKAHKVGDIHPNGKWVWTQLPSGKYDWRVIKKTGAGSGAAAPSTAQNQMSEGKKSWDNLSDFYKNGSDERKMWMEWDRFQKTGDHNRISSIRKILEKKFPNVSSWKHFAPNMNSSKLVAVGADGKEIASIDFGGKGVDLPKLQTFMDKCSAVKKKEPEADYDIAEYNRQRGLAEKTSDEALSFGLNVVKNNLSRKEKELSEMQSQRPGAKATIAKLKNEVKFFKGQEKAISEEIKSREEASKLPKIKLTEKDFHKSPAEVDEYNKNAPLRLNDYTAEPVYYYTDDGKKVKSEPFIHEFYSSHRQDAVGGYEAYFDTAGSIGTFRTFKEAVSALEDWINKLRVKGHAKPKWIYNAKKGVHQMNYQLD